MYIYIIILIIIFIFVGFAVAVKSILNLSKELFIVTNYKYLLTYKFSQDHLEIFFPKTRQRFGHNNNPNVLEFRTAMKQLCLKNLITSSYAANCVALDNSCYDSIFEIRWKKRKSEEIIEDDDEKIPDFLSFENDSVNINILKDNILYYISGFIVRTIFKKIECPTCTESLLERKTTIDHNYSHTNSYSALVNIKNRGGLVRSSTDVLKIVKFVENTLIQLTDNFKHLKLGSYSKIVIHTKNYVYSNNVFKNLSCLDDCFLENHKLHLVSLICKEYLKIRLHYIAKSKDKQVSKRRVLTKLILFNNQ